MFRSWALFVLLSSITATRVSASLCRVDSVDSVHYLLSNADAVVHVEAVRQLPPASGDWREFFPLTADRVEFRVISVLKGESVDSTLVVHGRLVDKDDFNDDEMPYSFVRREGRLGSCFAGTYRVGGQYLFILRRRDATFTPYWSPIAPTNEQVRGSDDTWVWWVRGYLDALKASHAQAVDPA